MGSTVWRNWQVISSLGQKFVELQILSVARRFLYDKLGELRSRFSVYRQGFLFCFVFVLFCFVLLLLLLLFFSTFSLFNPQGVMTSPPSSGKSLPAAA